VSRLHGRITDYDLASLGIGWYTDWGTQLHPLRPDGVEYVQLVWIEDGQPTLSNEKLGLIVESNPGSLWLIGNEPECTHQGNSAPEQYAQVYHKLHGLIKERDPEARIAVGGVVQPTPLRLQWLDRMLGHYLTAFGEPMPVDVWNIHNMILPEVRGGWGCEIPRGLDDDLGRQYSMEDNASIDIFVDHIVAFRSWMLERGQRNKPLVISEYGVLMPAEYGFTVQRVSAFMAATFDYLLNACDEELGYPSDGNRLVQRWAWFSLNEKPWDAESGEGFNGALFDHRYSAYPGVLTELGEHFAKYVSALGQAPITGEEGTEETAQSPALEPAATPFVATSPTAALMNASARAEVGAPTARTASTEALVRANAPDAVGSRTPGAVGEEDSQAPGMEGGSDRSGDSLGDLALRAGAVLLGMCTMVLAIRRLLLRR
jgi:hypothetical protein